MADSNLKFNVLVSAQTEALLKLAEVVDRLTSKLDELDRKKVNVPVDADTAKADAKLAETKKQADALDGKNINIKVDSSQVEQAGERMSRLQMIALAVAAAFPFVAAAILALPAALALVAAPLAAIVLGMDGIKAAVQPLSAAFGDLKTQVSEVFAGQLQPAVRNLAAVFPTLTTGLQGTAQALSNVATQVTSVVSSSSGLSQLKGIFQGVNDLISNMAPGIAQFTDNILNLAQSGIQGLQPFAEVFNKIADAWKSTIAEMNQSGTVQAAVSGLVQVLGGLLAILPPLVEIGAKLMAVVGPPLAAALNAVAGVLGFLAGPLGTVTALVLEAVAAWKLLGLASSAITSLGTKLGGAVTSMGGYATASKQAATASEGFSAAGTRVSSTLSKIGSALPAVGMAALFLVDAFQQAQKANEEMATAFMKGGAKADAITAGWKRLGEIWGPLGAGIKTVTEDSKAQYDALSLVGKAQVDAESAANNYDNAVQKFGPTSAQAVIAHAVLLAALQRYKDAQQSATDATKSGADALHEHIGTISGLIATHQAYGAALKATAKATGEYNAALKSGDQDLIAQKTEILVGAIDDQATALANQAKVATQSLGPTASLAEQNRAYVNSLGDSAATLQGPARTALLGYIDILSTADLQTISSANHVSGLKTQIITLPSGRKVEIAVDAQAALEQVANIKKQIGEITGTVHKVTMGLLTNVAESLLGGFKTHVDNTHGTAHVDAESSGGTATLEGWKAVVGGTTATAHQNADPTSANGILQAWVSRVFGTTATSHQNAEPTGANSILSSWVAHVFGTTGTSHLNSEPSGANSVLAGVLAAVGRAVGTMHIRGADEASGLINAITSRYYAAYIHIISVGAAVGGASALAPYHGAIGTPSGTPMMARGGVIRSFGQAGLADIAAPSTFRAIYGDRPDVNESYIPWNRDQRSLSILATTAHAMGQSLVPNVEGGSGYTPKASPAYATQLPRAAQGAVSHVYNVAVTFQNAINAMDRATLRQAAVTIQDEIKKLDGSRR